MTEQPSQYGAAPDLPPVQVYPYAHWGQRVGAFLIDYLLYMAAAAPLWTGYGLLAASVDTTTRADGTLVATDVDVSPAVVGLMVLGGLTALAFFIWNYCLRGGRTGWTVGKGVVGIRLVSTRTGQPIGAGMAFLRQIAHILDGLPCYLGYLWPLWDAKRQTFADKVISTVVVVQPRG